MAKSTETLNRIMKILNMSEMIAQETLENGTVVEADEFVAGAEIFIVTEDGENVALPVGDYTMADGKILKVAEEGIIASIDEAEPAEAPAEEAPAEAQLEEEEKENSSRGSKLCDQRRVGSSS